MPRKKKETVATPTPQEQFATAYTAALNYPADHKDAFKGKNPGAAASEYQRGVLGKMGIEANESTTQLQAHASIKAFAEVFPERSDAIWAEQSAEAAARKAAGAKAPDAGKPQGGKFDAYTVPAEQAGKPATYHMMVQLKEAGVRPYNSTDPVPNRGEVATTMEALRTSDKAKYDAVMSKAADVVKEWKHMAPSASQTAMAEAAGIKVTPFRAAEGEKGQEGYKEQRGSTCNSIGEKLHELKTTEPEKYAAAKAALVASKEAAKNPAVGTPTLSLEEKVKGAVAAKKAGEAAKTADVPTLTLPATPAPSVQTEAQAGE